MRVRLKIQQSGMIVGERASRTDEWWWNPHPRGRSWSLIGERRLLATTVVGGKTNGRLHMQVIWWQKSVIACNIYFYSSNMMCGPCGEWKVWRDLIFICVTKIISNSFCGEWESKWMWKQLLWPVLSIHLRLSAMSQWRHMSVWLVLFFCSTQCRKCWCREGGWQN